MSPAPPSVDRDKLPHVPDRIGRYDILLPIASGGMATVYLARMSGAGGFERDVAIKLTHAHLLETPDFSNDLIEEAKLAAQIKHPNVVSTLDVGEDRLGVYLVMDYVEGDSLTGLRRRAKKAHKPLPARISVPILLDAMAGLHAAHELRGREGKLLQLVHRDFSPQNVLVGVDGIGRLTDFGIAKAVTRLGHTATGLVKGKLPYVAPEQARGMPLDRRCDVWAAGVVAWELLTGKRLFRKGNEVELILKLVTQTPPGVRQVRPKLSAEVEQAVARALRLDRNERYPTAAAFAQALRDALSATGDLAEPDERAAYVRGLVGPKLAERQARVDELWELRARVDELSHGDTGADLITSSEREQVPLFRARASSAGSGEHEPSEHAAVAGSESAPSASASRVEEADTEDEETAATTAESAIASGADGEAAGPVELEDAETLDAQTASAPAAAHELRSEVEPPVERTRTDTTSVSESAMVSLTARKPAWRRPAGLIGAAALLIGGALAVVVSLPDEEAKSSSTAAATVAVAAPPELVATTAPPSATSAPAPSAPASGDAAALPAVTVTVRANAPIAELVIADVEVDIPTPQRRVVAPLANLERGRRVELRAKAKDGRRTKATLTVGDDEVTIRFPPARAWRPRPPAASPIPDSPYSR